MTGLALLVLAVLVVLLIAVYPRPGAYNAGWGYAPSGTLAVLLLLAFVFVWTGRL